MEYSSIYPKPFIKWVGGKRSIIEELSCRMPENYNVYNECFIGGGILFFSTQPKHAYLSDINYNLIVTYRAIRDNLNGVISELRQHAIKHDKPYYLEARENIAIEKDPIKIAGFFIYLNKTCYNGLYRVNKAGKFNVPMGQQKSLTILNESNLINVSKALKNSIIKHMSFEKIEPRKEDFYYLDPPYYKTYSSYISDGFTENQHKELYKKCNDINAAGGYFMLSNSDTDFIRNLYKEFNIENIMAGRYLSCKGNQRGKKSELIIRNYE